MTQYPTHNHNLSDDKSGPEERSSQQVFGRLLRFWRAVHGLSQEELAHRLDSSPRHLSRLENGSSRPSEHMIEVLALAMSLGERDRNHLRIAAGYGPQQPCIGFQEPQLKWLRKAMKLTLRAMDPYPTTLMDAAGNLLMVNRAWVGFYQARIPAGQLAQVVNHFEFLFSRQGAGPLMKGWEDTLSLIVMSLVQQAILSDKLNITDLSASGPDLAAIGKVDAPLARLLQHPELPADWAQRAARLEPMASFRVQADYQGQLHQFYSVSQTVGALGPAAYPSEPRLTVSTLYPEDEQLNLMPLLDGELQHPLLFY